MQGNRVVMDCLTCGLELYSPACLNSHLKTLSMLESKFNTMRYEEEIIIDFDEAKSSIITEYLQIVRQIEQIMIRPDTYGHPQDDKYAMRKKLLSDFYEYLFMNPLMAARKLQEYSEPMPERQIFMEGYRRYQAWVNGILKTYSACQLYNITAKTGDLRQTFLSLAGLKSLQFISNILLSLPDGARLIQSPDNNYSLGYGITVRVYEIPKSEANLYVQENPVVEALPRDLQNMMKNEIVSGMKEPQEGVDYSTIFESKMREYRQKFMDEATLKNIAITPQQALAMGREVAAWTVGLGAPIENISLDRDNITDIYIDSENSPLYMEHAKFGLCHTLWRYNRDMLEHAFGNIMAITKQTRKFDDKNPVIDVMLTRLNMRCHLQRPPATFGELQAALRLTKESPFTYAQYLFYNSFSAFFAGYDDVMVSLGCSEAVLGLKGVGKTAFTSAKISAIGTKRRILPIQDIEEIPTKAYRKRGFHIGAMRVQSSDKEETTTSELDLVTMANASLRMGDSCLIINEIRSRLAIQGVINLLNTQPGVFLLYNLHAQSLRDIADRLELVFGVPSASMFTTDRYSFLKKLRFGRKGRTFRIIGAQYETDQANRKFSELFTFKRGENIASSSLLCNFVKNPEANLWSLSGVSLTKLSKELNVTFIPPALQRRCDETGIPPEQYIMQAFFKGKIYSDIHEAATKLNDKELREIDFVLKANSAANKLLKEKEREDGSIDWATLEPVWDKQFKALIDQDRRDRASLAAATGSAGVSLAPAPLPGELARPAPGAPAPSAGGKPPAPPAQQAKTDSGKGTAAKMAELAARAKAAKAAADKAKASKS